MEINVSTKRKLGFLTGTVQRSQDDPVKADQWDAYNNLVIAWIMNAVCEPIAKSILYIEIKCGIWKHLEKRFAVGNGSRKYKLNRELYNLKQSNLSVNDIYTQFRGIWEELDSMESLPRIRNAAAEIEELLKCICRYREEQRLFQFLNCLNDVYAAQRSQILIMTPLPSVEEACSMLQQEEAQN